MITDAAEYGETLGRLRDATVAAGRPRDAVTAGLEHVYLVNVTALGDVTKAASSTALLTNILGGLRRLG